MLVPNCKEIPDLLLVKVGDNISKVTSCKCRHISILLHKDILKIVEENSTINSDHSDILPLSSLESIKFMEWECIISELLVEFFTFLYLCPYLGNHGLWENLGGVHSSSNESYN